MKTYIATTAIYPVIGKRMLCFVVSFDNGLPALKEIVTSEVIKVEVRDDSIYEVYTKHSLYIVKYVSSED